LVICATVSDVQCCGSGKFIPDLDPDFCPSRIPDPKIATKERGGKKICCPPFFGPTNITKFKIILFLNWANLQRITELFTQKIVIKLKKI
jgi:hypothetical protein